MTRVTPDAPRRKSQEVIEHMKSKDKSSAQSWRRDTNHLYSKLQEAPKTLSTPQLPSLQDKMAKAMYVEETVLLSSGRSREKLFLSCGENDSENLEVQVSHRSTSRTRHKELATDSVKSLSLALRSFRRTMSQAEDSTSLKEEETVQWSLLMAQDKGKYNWGSQEPLSEPGSDDHIILLIAEQKLHGRASRVCKDHGITSPHAWQRIYLQAREEAIASMRVRGPHEPDEEDKGFEDHFMGALTLLMSIQHGLQGTSPSTLPPKSPCMDSTHRMSKEDATMPATTGIGIMTQSQDVNPANSCMREDLSQGMSTSSVNIVVPMEVRQLPGLPTILEDPNIAGAIAGLIAPWQSGETTQRYEQCHAAAGWYRGSPITPAFFRQAGEPSEQRMEQVAPPKVNMQSEPEEELLVSLPKKKPQQISMAEKLEDRMATSGFVMKQPPNVSIEFYNSQMMNRCMISGQAPWVQFHLHITWPGHRISGLSLLVLECSRWRPQEHSQWPCAETSLIILQLCYIGEGKHQRTVDTGAGYATHSCSCESEQGSWWLTLHSVNPQNIVTL